MAAAASAARADEAAASAAVTAASPTGDAAPNVAAERSPKPSDRNPFALPSDDDLFLAREREAEQRRARRERMKTLKIWEKTATTADEKAAQGAEVPLSTALRQSRGAQRKVAAQVKANTLATTRRERENLAEFIAKKRQMFLLQMSLDTKKEEIKKLEEKALLKEEALKRSEHMLQEDAARFDAFLKENDKKAHEALKRADKETKLKQEKALEIKKLNQEISKVESEMSKYEERLAFCLKYKEFLDELTPPEHLERCRKAREAREAQRHEQRGSEEAEAEADAQVASESEADEMFFKDPAQLLEIFAQLEERNLFLIQNVQETEEALEELKQKHKDTKVHLEAKTAQLKANIDELNAKIHAENEKASLLQQRARFSTGAGDQVALLNALAAKVTEVYVACGFDTTDIDTLDMLRQMEGKLEELLVKMSQMDPELLAKGEKEKEIERRERVRQAKYEEQKRLDEERVRKSNARAKAEIKKKVGKQVMFRSPPLKKKKKTAKTQQQKDKEQEDFEQFLS